MEADVEDFSAYTMHLLPFQVSLGLASYVV
jgi:hypothetical protein